MNETGWRRRGGGRFQRSYKTADAEGVKEEEEKKKDDEEEGEEEEEVGDSGCGCGSGGGNGGGGGGIGGWVVAELVCGAFGLENPHYPLTKLHTYQPRHSTT